MAHSDFQNVVDDLYSLGLELWNDNTEKEEDFNYIHLYGTIKGIEVHNTNIEVKYWPEQRLMHFIVSFGKPYTWPILFRDTDAEAGEAEVAAFNVHHTDKSYGAIGYCACDFRDEMYDFIACGARSLGEDLTEWSEKIENKRLYDGY